MSKNNIGERKKMNIIEFIHDLINGVNEIYSNDEGYVTYSLTQQNSFVDYEEAKELIESNIMTPEDLVITERNYKNLTKNLATILVKAVKYHGTLEKIEYELKTTLSKYKFSKNYIDYLTHELIERIKEDIEK